MLNKIFKRIIAGLLAVVLMSQLLPMHVSAAQFFYYGRHPIFVDGQFFETWGINGLLLQDAAFIFNGTSAQFDIAEPPDGWDFWIRRGEAYTSDGTELQPVSARHANARLNVDSFSDWLHPTPYRRNWIWTRTSRQVVLGLDGGDYPAFTISLDVFYYLEDIFFDLRDLALWLGFMLESEVWEDGRGADFIIETACKQNLPTPGRFILRDTFPIGTLQKIDYAYALRVRTGPSNDYDVLTFVHRGDEFEILDYSGRFVQIYTSHGAGWIFAGFLSRERNRL